jgi:protein-tyrosine phosphatase
MTTLVDRAGRADAIDCDSAGTDGYHEGEHADPRMREHALRRGFRLASRSRPLRDSDFSDFDLILTMDEHNLSEVTKRAPRTGHRAGIERMTSFCRVHTERDVPDPYYGGEHGFERVLDILQDACAGLLEHLEEGRDK